jgi:hypothetical protein
MELMEFWLRDVIQENATTQREISMLEGNFSCLKSI